MSSKLLKEIRRVVKLQTLLITEFCRSYPGVKDSSSLRRAPGTGCLDTTEGYWLFRRHGAGVCFLNAQGVEIDAHRAFGSSDLFDVWRIHLYLESASEDDFPGLERLQDMFEDLIEIGELVRQPDGLFSLAKPAKAISLIAEPRSVRSDKLEAITKLVANGLYEIRQRLGTGREEGMPPNVDVAARLSYALHNEALFLLGEQYEADLEVAMRRIRTIDDDFPGEKLFESFQRALSGGGSGPGSELD